MKLAGIIISQLTPPGRGAVASILVAGPGAIELVSRHFSPASGKSLLELPIGRVVFGSFRPLEDAVEEVVVGLHDKDHVEIHSHGGAFASTAVMKVLASQGATIVPWQQVAERAESDRIAMEARVALAAARTEKTAGVLLEQYQGALRRCVQEIATAIEGQPESHITSIARLQRLLALAPLGKHLAQPWRVFIAGAPNVGKSSLMNALVGYQRSIVFDQPGTTRDLLTAVTALDGWPVEVIDSAGLRESDDALEAAGVARATAGIAEADLVLGVEDATTTGLTVVAEHTPKNSSVIIVKNKADLLPASASLPVVDELVVSALTGQGLDRLCQRIVEQLMPFPPARGEAVIFTQRQEQAIQEAATALSSGDGRLAVTWLRSL